MNIRRFLVLKFYQAWGRFDAFSHFNEFEGFTAHQFASFTSSFFCFHHETFIAFVSIPSSNSTPSGGSSDLQDRLTAAVSSIHTSDGARIFELDQDPSLSLLTEVGMANPSMCAPSTRSSHSDSQLLEELTGKSADSLDMVDVLLPPVV